jgi:DNA-binding NarL/FixJ family response regulator
VSSQTTRRTAVLLDRHPLWLEGIEAVLCRGGINVVAKTTSPTKALGLIEHHRPSLFVLGVHKDDREMDGPTCLRLARERAAGTKVIVLSESEDARDIQAAFSGGATAYVMKSAHAEDLASAVRQAFSHSIYFANGASLNGDPTAAGDTASPGLTARERQILELVVDGLTNAEVARMLWVTPETIKFHLSNTYRKLGVSNRTEASRWAIRNGIVDSG